MKFNNYYNKKLEYIIDTLVDNNKSQSNIENFENSSLTQSNVLNIDNNKKKNEQLYLQNIIKNIQNKKKKLLSKDNKIYTNNKNNEASSNKLNNVTDINKVTFNKSDNIDNTSNKLNSVNDSNKVISNNLYDINDTISILNNIDKDIVNENKKNLCNKLNNDKLIKSNVPTKKKEIDSVKSNYDYVSYIDIKLDISIFDNYQNILVVSKEPILYCCCIILYKKFLYLTDNKRDQFIKELKYMMAIDLDKKNLYSKLKYNHKRFKKTEFQDSLINNKVMNNEYFYTYIGDYFKVNILLKDNDIINYLNNYNENRYSILLIKKDKYFYVHFNCENLSFIDHELCLKHNILINNVKKTSKNTLSNLKIGELQNIAKGKNIDIKKQGKTGLINKSKKELLEEINK
tara:strand:+ start:1230 stop:2432 length:1203 start_codon:yes stop_codon:yes gene_type:complete